MQGAEIQSLRPSLAVYPPKFPISMRQTSESLLGFLAKIKWGRLPVREGQGRLLEPKLLEQPWVSTTFLCLSLICKVKITVKVAMSIKPSKYNNSIKQSVHGSKTTKIIHYFFLLCMIKGLLQLSSGRVSLVYTYASQGSWLLRCLTKISETPLSIPMSPPPPEMRTFSIFSCVSPHSKTACRTFTTAFK